MATLADNVLALGAAVTALQTAVNSLATQIASLPVSTPVDLSPVLAAVSGVDADVKAVLTQVSPTV